MYLVYTAELVTERMREMLPIILSISNMSLSQEMKFAYSNGTLSTQESEVMNKTARFGVVD